MCDCDVLVELTDEVFEAKRDEPVQGPRVHGAAKWNNAILELLLEAS